MKKLSPSLSKYLPGLLLIVGAIVLVLPQVVTQRMLLGSDSIFHYNRFYEAAMQLKNGNLHYFITMYGFQESGRIVNAVYGPAVAYFNGILLLLGKTWFNFQIISDIAVYLLAGTGMYLLLRKCAIRRSYSILLALFYLTTYAIQYWTISQAFSGWAASLLPFCLFPIVTFVRKKEVNILELAICTALMIQTHFLTSLFVIMIYVPCFGYAFFKTDKRGKLLGKLCLAIGLFLLLTANIWAGLLEVNLSNKILSPFINKNMYGTAISLNGYRLTNWLAPIALVFFGALQIILLVKYWKKISALNRLVSLEALVFLVLSSKLLPWKWLSVNVPGVDILQFPFRFFVPYIVLLIISIGLFFMELGWSKKKVLVALSVIVIASFGQAMYNLNTALSKWDNATEFMYHKNTLCFNDDAQDIKNSFFSTDLSLGLKYVQKSTPDYLPLYTDTTDPRKVHGYHNYHWQVIQKEVVFRKIATKNGLVVKWKAKKAKQITLPVVGYSHTEVTLNGKKLKSSEVKHTTIGMIKVNQKKGKNTLVLSYHPAKLVNWAIILTSFVWVICGGIILVKRFRKNK